MDSPLREARLTLKLSLGQVGAATKLSKCLLSLIETGKRTPPPALLTFLGFRLGLDRIQTLAAAHAEWRAATQRQKTKPTLTLEVTLPPGVTEEQARLACVEALAGIEGESVRP